MFKLKTVKLREVSNFEKLKQLIVSGKLLQTLDRETGAHISVRQSDSWFDPVILAKEADLYFVSDLISRGMDPEKLVKN